jgi:hypothetical protein
MRKEAAMESFKEIFRQLSEETGENHESLSVSIVDVSTEIRAEQHPK